MMNFRNTTFAAFLFIIILAYPAAAQDLFPDGTPVSDWFRETEVVSLETLGKTFVITEYGVRNDSTELQTDKIQAVIDAAYQAGGGVILIPRGTFLSGSLFFQTGYAFASAGGSCAQRKR